MLSRSLLVVFATFIISTCMTSSAEAGQVKIITEFRFDPPETITGVLKFPEGDGPFPAVVLMHGCGGLHKAVLAGLRSHARDLRDVGFATLILDSFGPRGWGGGKICREGNSGYAKARYKRSADAFSAHKFLENDPRIDGKNIFAMGQSNGGSVAIIISQPQGQMLHRPKRKFTAVVAYYPWCGVFKGPKLITPLLVLIGDKDDWTPHGNCQSIESFMTGEPYELKLYPNTTHSFDLPDLNTKWLGHTLRSNPSATKDSRSRMISFFKKHMVP